MRQDKVTFEDVHKDFKRHFPNLSKKAAYWKPNGYLSIQVIFQDGSQLIYDYLYKKGVLTILPETVT